jgi:hypothetical protein
VGFHMGSLIHSGRTDGAKAAYTDLEPGTSPASLCTWPLPVVSGSSSLLGSVRALGDL